MDPEIINLSVKLTEAATRQTYEFISNKVKLAKERNDIKEKENIYQEIINDLLQDKNDLESIANQYKNLYEKVSISDDDIEHLHNTLRQLLNVIKKYSQLSDEVIEEDDIQLFLNLLNKDTLKTAQLLGFNYKEAIGEPFTKVVSEKILSLSSNTNKRKRK